MTDQPQGQIHAKFDGRCEFCGEAIEQGDVIAYSAENDTWVHLRCWVDDRTEPEEAEGEV